MNVFKRILFHNKPRRLPAVRQNHTAVFNEDGVWKEETEGVQKPFMNVPQEGATDEEKEAFWAFAGVFPGELDGTAWVGGDLTGNARGAGALDVQAGRTADTQVASGANGSAFGYGNTASGDYASAAGYGNTASGDNGNAFGYGNTASATNASALGHGNTASGVHATAVGRDNTAGSGNRASAFGHTNSATGLKSSAFGYDNGATWANSSAFGYKNTASGYASAFGLLNTASGTYSSAFGYDNEASEYGSSAVGRGNTASGPDSSAVGNSNTSSGTYGGSSAFGYDNEASGSYSVAMGNKCTASGDSSAAVGVFVAAGIDNVSEFGAWSYYGRGAAVRCHGTTGMVAMTVQQRDTAFGYSGASAGSEADNTLASGMAALRIHTSNGNCYLDWNDGGTIRTITLGDFIP